MSPHGPKGSARLAARPTSTVPSHQDYGTGQSPVKATRKGAPRYTWRTTHSDLSPAANFLPFRPVLSAPDPRPRPPVASLNWDNWDEHAARYSLDDTDDQAGADELGLELEAEEGGRS